MGNQQKVSFIVKNFYKFLAVFFVLALAACGSGGSGGGDSAPGTASIEMASSVPSGEQLPQNGTATITATVFDENGKRVTDGTEVEFTATAGRITELVGTVGGVATVPYFAPTAGGVVTITSKLTNLLGVVEASSALNLTIAASPASLTLETSLPPGDQLAQGGTTTVTATVIGDDGTLVADGTEVLFVATDGIIAAAAQTVLGKATASYTAPLKGGLITITATAGAATNFIDLIIASGPAAWIQVESITPERLGLKGTGVDEAGAFVFNVKDGSGNPVSDGQIISFNLDSPTGGGETLSASSAITLNGSVSVSLLSGTVPGVATVTASTVSGTAPVTTQANITMGYGKTDQNHISLSFTPFNIAGMLFDGLKTELGAYAGDRFSNPVSENTPMFFASSCGIVDLPGGVALTGSDGSATADWITANPRSSLCTTIMWTAGEEAYDDLNANGIYDDGEPHEGIGEPYIDENQNDQFDAGELYFDRDGNGQYTPADTTWDGDTFVWVDGVTRWSSTTATPVISPTSFNITIGGSQAFQITVADVNGAPLPEGTKVSVTTDCQKSSLNGDTDVTLADSVYPGLGRTIFNVVLSSTDTTAGDPAPCSLTVDVSAELNGDRTRSVNGTID